MDSTGGAGWPAALSRSIAFVCLWWGGAACAAIPACAATVSAHPRVTSSTPSKVLFDQQSPYQRVLVSDEGPLRVMRFGHAQASEQSSLVRGRPGALPIEYTRYALLGLAHHGAPRRLLMVGLGGGTFTTVVHGALPDIAIDAVEIDPVVVAAARAFFDLREDARYRVHVADAVAWVATASDAFDYVFLDSYAGEVIPEALRTVAFFKSVAGRLAPGGIVGLNIAELEGEGTEVVRALRTVLQPFDCWQAPVDGNLMIFAALGPRPFDQAAFSRWLDAWDARHVTDVALRTLVARRSGGDCARVLGPGGPWMP